MSSTQRILTTAFVLPLSLLAGRTVFLPQRVEADQPRAIADLEAAGDKRLSLDLDDPRTEFDNIVFGGGVTMVDFAGETYVDAARRRLGLLLQERIAEFAADVQISTAEAGKLELAGRGDIERLLEGIADCRRRFGLAPGDERLRAEAAQLQRLVVSGPFDDRSLLFKTLRTVLGEARMARLEVLRAVRQLNAVAAAELRSGQRGAARARYRELAALQPDNPDWPARLAQLESGVDALWNFDLDLEGWEPNPDYRATAEGGVLRLESAGPDPWVRTRVSSPAGWKMLTVRVKSEQPEQLQLFWTTWTRPEIKDPEMQESEANSRTVRVEPGPDWQELKLVFQPDAPLASLRLDTENFRIGSRVEIDSIILQTIDENSGRRHAARARYQELAALQPENPDWPARLAQLESFDAVWNFDLDWEGWVPNPDCRATAEGGALRLESAGVDPYVRTRLASPAGWKMLAVRVKSAQPEQLQLFWTTTSKIDESETQESEDNSTTVRVNAGPDWQELKFVFQPDAPLATLRLDTENYRIGSRVEIDSMVLQTIDEKRARALMRQ